MVLECPLCSLLCPSLKAYVSHLRLVHGEDRDFYLFCGINNCQQEFLAFSAFNSHVYRHHRNELGLDGTCFLPDLEPEIDDPVVTPPVEQHMYNFDEDDSEFHHDLSYLLHTDRFEQQKKSAAFLLRLREVRGVTQKTVSEVVRENQAQFNRTIGRTKALVKDSLHLAGINYYDVEGLDSALLDLSAPYQGLETVYKQDKFYSEHFNFLEPQEIPYEDSERYVNRFSGQKRQKVRTQDVFYYVPIMETLKRILVHPEVQQELQFDHSCLDNLSDFCDGSTFKRSELFNSNKNALQIIAYYDELEVCNPLGSYVTLGNIRPQHRSSLKAILLLGLGKATDITKYGIDCFLKPFVEDLKTLYCDGVCIGGIDYYGRLVAFLADTLAAHLLGGFKGSMSFAHRICRSCMITTEQAQTCFNESSCVLRTPETHFKQSQKLTGLPNDSNSVDYGINRLSILEEVPEFSVVNGLPHDLMHDIMEGVVPYELKCLLSYCVHNKIFTITELNDRIKGYDFGSEDRPAVIDPLVVRRDSDTRLRQSASQMISLVRNFTMLIGDKVAPDDERWQSFLVLLKICLISMSSTYSQETRPYLRVLIEEKLWLLRHLYPDMRLKPKMHYLVHYPSQIERLGPLIQSWTMRHEAKLSFMKRSSRRGNFKNICKTVARHHQLWLCYQLNFEPNWLHSVPEVSPKGTDSPLRSKPVHMQEDLLQLCPTLQEDDIINYPNWIKLQGSTYNPGAVVLLHWDELTPKFGRILNILQLSDAYVRFVLLVEVFQAQHFCSHYNAYVVCSCTTTEMVDVNRLLDHHTLRIRKSFLLSDHNLYISMPYVPCDNN